MYNFHLIGLSEVSKDSSLVNEIIPSFTDRLQVGGQTVALGMLIVFVVLALLWIILEVAGHMASKQSEPKIKAIEQVPVAAANPAPIVQEQTSYENDEEVVAAITAAISLMLEAENAPVKGFRVVSFKRVSNNAHWNR